MYSYPGEYELPGVTVYLFFTKNKKRQAGYTHLFSKVIAGLRQSLDPQREIHRTIHNGFRFLTAASPELHISEDTLFPHVDEELSQHRPVAITTGEIVSR